MSLPWWKPDEDLLAAALAEIDERVAEVRRALSLVAPLDGREGLPGGQAGPADSGLHVDHDRAAATDQMRDLLDAIGTAVFLGASDTVREHLGDLVGSPVARGLAAAALSRLIEESLTPALSGLMNDFYELATAEDGAKEVLEERIVDALAERDRVELAMEGARFLCNFEPALDDEVLASLAAFDEVLKAELWRTLPLGDRRAARCAWAAPSYRERLWWWFRGCDLPHTALQDMQTAARVIHLFPEAREELERMLQAEQDLDNLCTAGRDRSRGKVISLRDYLLAKAFPVADSGRTPASVPEACVAYGLAASHHEEKPLYCTAELTVSTDGENLIVDIEHPAKPTADSLPVLEASGYAPLRARKALEPDRFEFALSSSLFSAPEAWLVVSLVTSEQRIRLPFDEHE